MAVEKGPRTEARKESCSETAKGREPQTDRGADQAAGGAHEPVKHEEKRHRTPSCGSSALPESGSAAGAAARSGVRGEGDRAGGSRMAGEAGRARASMIAIDWGTTSFRAYRLDSEGLILDTRNAAKGIL